MKRINKYATPKQTRFRHRGSGPSASRKTRLSPMVRFDGVQGDMVRTEADRHTDRQRDRVHQTGATSRQTEPRQNRQIDRVPAARDSSADLCKTERIHTDRGPTGRFPTERIHTYSMQSDQVEAAHGRKDPDRKLLMGKFE